jgi:hypothetical protein
MSQRERSLQEKTTSMSPADTIAAAKRFFAVENRSYAAYPEQEGPNYVTLRGMGGEEIVVGAVAADGATKVSGSTYLFDQQVARFLSTLPPVAV